MAQQLLQQAFRFALDPTPAQSRMMASHAGGARFAFNCGRQTSPTGIHAQQRTGRQGETSHFGAVSRALTS